MNYKRSENSYYRKPVTFSLYYILLVKSGTIWTIDCEAWDESVILLAAKTEKRFNPEKQIKVVTSPSDDDTVIRKIVAEMNRYSIR